MVLLSMNLSNSPFKAFNYELCEEQFAQFYAVLSCPSPLIYSRAVKHVAQGLHVALDTFFGAPPHPQASFPKHINA